MNPFGVRSCNMRTMDSRESAMDSIWRTANASRTLLSPASASKEIVLFPLGIELHPAIAASTASVVVLAMVPVDCVHAGTFTSYAVNVIGHPRAINYGCIVPDILNASKLVDCALDEFETFNHFFGRSNIVFGAVEVPVVCSGFRCFDDPNGVHARFLNSYKSSSKAFS